MLQFIVRNSLVAIQLPLTREPSVVVRGEGWMWFWKGWCGNPSGSRPNFFGRQHLTFDKGGKDMVLSEGVWGFERAVGMVGSWDGEQVGMAMDLQKNGRCC